MKQEITPYAPEVTSKIVVEIRRDSGGPTIRKSFDGRWLVSPDDNLRAEQDNSEVSWARDYRYCLAKTKKGALAVYQYDEENADGPATLDVYETFESIRDATVDNRYRAYPDNVIAAFSDALGEPFEIELDI